MISMSTHIQDPPRMRISTTRKLRAWRSIESLFKLKTHDSVAAHAILALVCSKGKAETELWKVSADCTYIENRRM